MNQILVFFCILAVAIFCYAQKPSPSPCSNLDTPYPGQMIGQFEILMLLNDTVQIMEEGIVYSGDGMIRIDSVGKASGFKFAVQIYQNLSTNQQWIIQNGKCTKSIAPVSPLTNKDFNFSSFGNIGGSSTTIFTVKSKNFDGTFTLGTAGCVPIVFSGTYQKDTLITETFKNVAYFVPPGSFTLPAICNQPKLDWFDTTPHPRRGRSFVLGY